MSYIDIVPIGRIEETTLISLKHNLIKAFKIQTRIRNCPIDASAVYDPIRNQYNSSGLLVQLIKDIPSGTLKILGVTELDLFIPIFTFLFGEAQLNGPGALVSAHRLHNPFYGIPEDEGLFENRLLKESIHELGHAFGLIHCFNLRCVMNTSTYVEEIDQKSSNFCRACEQGILHWKNEHLTD
ncbi:MAG: archaemetzincin family Zn-dependent metalloprotease [Deltaproteobacteria bacterium]|nr:archaemetzincin family Zn-dependent metalloprotease [Deltaproteobacteria bacterium]MBM4322733.1 archaemetzincin family Zn-dependent metalloprotease [Deltaproteobacteria bacterium]